MTGLQRRYFELRYDGESNISGTAMVYGDVATFPWKDEESFEPRSFGDVSKLDLQLNKQHNRDAQIARTGGGGLLVRDSLTRLELEANLDVEDDVDARSTLSKVRRKILRGLSIEFMPVEWRIETRPNGAVRVIHTKAELRGFGVVDRPAYKQSTLSRTEFREAFEDMVGLDETTVKDLIREAMEGQPKTLSFDTDAMAEAMRTALEPVTASLGTVETRLKALETPTVDPEPTTDPQERTEEELEERVQARTDLLVTVATVLPKDFVARGKSTKDILVAAVGDEVENAETRSEDYLQAKVEGILERRNKVENRNIPDPTKPNTTTQTGPVNLIRMIENKTLVGAK